MDVSRSGRIRKKSSKLADFESPDDIDPKSKSTGAAGGGGGSSSSGGGRKNSSSSTGNLLRDLAASASYLIEDPDSPPEDLDDLHEADYEIKEEEFDEIPHISCEGEDDLDEVDVESHVDSKLEVSQLQGQLLDSSSAAAGASKLMTDDLDLEEEGALMIDDSRPSSKKSKTAAAKSSIYFSEKRNKVGGIGSRGSFDKPTKKAARKDKGKPRFTAYMLWAKANRDRVMQERPELAGNFSAISKQLGVVWSSVPMSEKYQWKRKANKLSLKMLMAARKQAQLAAKAEAAMMSPPPPPPPRHAAHQSTQQTQQLTSPPVMSTTGLFKVVGTEPLDCAAHLKLLGESLSVIGERLTEHEGQIAVSGSLSVLLDSLLCAVAPLLCMTQQVPELNGIPEEKLKRMLDNIAYIMPGL